MPVSGQVGEQIISPGVTTQPIRQGKLADLIVSELNGRYYENALNKRLFTAFASVTAPVVWTTAAGTGGPLLWNPPTSGVNATLLAITCALTVVTTVAAALGITGNSGQTVAPTTTTAIDGSGNNYVGGAASASKVFRIGTPSVAGTFFLPLLALHTGALTVDNQTIGWIDIGGAVIVPPGAWASVAASVTAATTVAQLGLLYAETPV
jgi:hypothetical protein